MKATVTYNEDGEPTRIKVSELGGHVVKFSMDGSTAVSHSVEPPEGEHEAYLDELSRFMEYVGHLPFVQAVRLAEPGPMGVDE